MAERKPAARDEAGSGPEALPAGAPAPGNEQVQADTDKAEDKGFFGVEVDPTPNKAYTVAGVTSGAPTPETDPELAREVRGKIDGR